MNSTYDPWTTSGVHKRNQTKVCNKAVPSLHISTAGCRWHCNNNKAR